MDNNEIRKEVKKILLRGKTKEMTILRNSNFVEYEKEMKKSFVQFHQIYPAIFKVCIQNPSKFEFNRLEEMLALRAKIKNNKISYEKASEEIGTKYFDEFMKPKLDPEIRDKYEKGILKMKEKNN